MQHRRCPRVLAPRSFRYTAVLAISVLTAACSTINPYLNPAPLNATVATPLACKDATGSPCETVRRFTQTQVAILELQMQAHKAYTTRASIKSVSSALAFPLAGAMLYQGVAHGDQEAVRNRLLKGGLGIAAAYEARNALLAGSPESVYLLSEARLMCVANESLRYRLDLPAGEAATACDKQAVDLNNEAGKLKAATAIDLDRKPAKDALLSKVDEAIDAYAGAEAKLDAGSNQMRLAALKIVTDTNAALNTSSTSFNQALGLMKSEMAAFAPAAATSADKPGGPKSNDEEKAKAQQKELEQMNALALNINKFARACIRPQPASVAAFDACTTYSPAAPVPPTVTTMLPGNELTMAPDEQKTFVITSTPSGTPWAAWPGNDAGVSAMAPPQLITLSPTQTQVTLHYKTAVAAETKTQLVLTTLGVAGNATTVNITLKPKPGATGAGTGTPPAASAWSKHAKDTALVAGLEYKGDVNDDQSFENALYERWRSLCPGVEEPADEKALMTEDFIKAVKAKTKTATPTASYCKPAAK